MYLKSTHRTSSIGLRSTSSFHTGLPSAFAQRSHTAFTTAAVARCIAPLSGPIQRSWLSPVMRRQKAPMSAAIASSVSPTMSGSSACAAATTTSFPRPIVNVRWLRGVEARADEHAGDPAEDPCDREDRHLPHVDVHAREARGLLVAAQREREAAEDRARQDQARHDRHTEEHQHEVGYVQS